MASAREVAMLTLAACERQGAWSDGHLKKSIRQAELDRRDAALATRLCFGVLQNRLYLDYYLQHFSNVKLDKIECKVLCALRIALYQVLFMDKIPDSAAVNESVSLARKHSKNPRSAGLVNAILRSILRRRDDLPTVEGRDAVETLSLRYSHPYWLVKEFVSMLGLERAEELLKTDNEQPPTMAQVNTVQIGVRELILELERAGVTAIRHPWLEDCLAIYGSGDLEHLEPFRSGLFYVQDAASRCAVKAAGVVPWDHVLDCCAAPGGKSFASAIAMNNEGSVLSCDIHAHKIGLIEAGRDRLGLSCLTAREQNASQFVQEWADQFDVVLTDVPCSGLGIIRKKPDIRYKDPKPFAGLPHVQTSIIMNACRYVKPGGVLLYSTCTLLKRENEDVVSAFLKEHPEFKLESFCLPEPVGESDGMLTLWPHLHGTDGFFIAKLRRAHK